MDSKLPAATRPDYSVYRNLIDDLLGGTEQLPSLPGIAFEIRKALEQPNLTMVSLSNLVAKDPALSAVLLKYASSPLMGNAKPPQTLLEVVRLLGLDQVERITMLHSMKSLYSMNSPRHKQLYMDAWRRLALKASLSAYIAKQVKQVLPDQVLMAALMSDVGTLAVLSAFKKSDGIPDTPTYVALCREYAKSLGVITLRKWKVDEEYLKVLQSIGHWQGVSPGPINLSDIINLGLYHSLKLSRPKADLPLLQDITAYQKLPEPHNRITSGCLELVMSNLPEIRVLAKNLFQS